MFDRYEDVAASLDRQLLRREEPPSHALAAKQLETAKISFSRIVRTNPEAILYLDEAGHAMTAWSEVRPTGVVVLYRQDGFPALMSPYLKEG